MQSAVLQGSVCHHPPLAQVRHKGGTGRKKARPSRVGADSRSFLNERIGTKQLSDVGLLDVELEQAYGNFVKGLKRFYGDLGRSLMIPNKGDISERMCQLLEWVCSDLEKIGLELSVWKIDDYDMDLNFTVYKNVLCLNDVLFTFYLSPIDCLKGQESDIYKRFIAFMTRCFGVCIDLAFPDNDYVSMILDSMFEDMDEEGEESRMLKFYKEERILKLFKEIDSMKVDEERLRKDIEDCMEKSDGDVRRLMEVMYKGMDILPHMCLGCYDFNPCNDGFRSNDSYIRIEQCVAFCYSCQDGLDEIIIDTVNNDCYCGLLTPGFNKYVHLDSDYSREEFDNLVGSDDIQERFVKWSDEFYQIEKKFDVWDL